MEGQEKGMTRRHTFFCVNKERHTSTSTIIEAQPKEIKIFGQKVKGWIITTEEPVIDKIIPLDESTQSDVLHHDPE